MSDKKLIAINDKKDILDVLQQLGWVENKTNTKDDIISIIQKEGYPAFTAVVDFLKLFLDSVIYFENKRNGLKNDDMNFSFERATNFEAPERINGSYSQRIGKELCLIGSAYRDHMVLMMSEDGYVYGGYDNFLCKISNTGLGAIEAIIYDRDFIEID